MLETYDQTVIAWCSTVLVRREMIRCSRNVCVHNHIECNSKAHHSSIASDDDRMKCDLKDCQLRVMIVVS